MVDSCKHRLTGIGPEENTVAQREICLVKCGDQVRPANRKTRMKPAKRKSVRLREKRFTEAI